MAELTPTEAFRSAVLSAAATAVVTQMTPEAMRACVEDIIQKTLADLTDEKYGGLRRVVHDTAEKIMKEHVQTPAVLAEIRMAVEAGIHEALKTLSASIRGKVVDLAIQGVEHTFTKQQRGY